MLWFSRQRLPIPRLARVSAIQIQHFLGNKKLRFGKPEAKLLETAKSAQGYEINSRQQSRHEVAIITGRWFAVAETGGAVTKLWRLGVVSFADGGGRRQSRGQTGRR